jgi:hypothetical protein
MKGDRQAFDRELQEIVERGRTVRSLPDVVRARALARARAAVAASASSPLALSESPAPRRRDLRLAVAAALTLFLGAAGAVAALQVGVLERVRSAPPPSPPAAVPPHIPAANPDPPAAEPLDRVKPRAERQPTAQESYAAELRLLHRAQVVYASDDFSAALVLVAEHARRFPRGRLSEEREALRVRSLVGSGRMEDARRATAAFAARFPRSVLLPRLQQTTRP